jgi:acetate---CoA ligase (ADP-forming)
LSHLISSGNETVTDAADYLAYLVDAPECQMICLFLETIRRPQEFRRQCDRAFAAGKPVIVLKSGRSEVSAAAAAAHTGALAQPDRLVDAVLRCHRVLRVGSFEEMFATVIVLQAGRRPRGNRVGLIANSGGLVDVASDAVAAADLELPPFSKTTIDELTPMFDIPGKVRNPIDIYPSLVDADAAFANTFAAVSRDDSIDIVMLTTNYGSGISQFMDVAKASEKPFVVVDAMPGAPPPETVREGLEAGVAIVSGLDACMRAVEHLIAHSRPEPAPVAAATGTSPEDAIMEELRERGGGTGMLALDALRLAGLNVPPTVIAHSADEAMQAATEIGFPVVVKDADPQNAHKTESGGVYLHLSSPAMVSDAVDTLVAAGVQDVLVQREAKIEHELILGLQTDPELGSFLVVGMGGIWAEILDDVAIRPVGLRTGETQQMLESLRVYPVLRGARGRPAADLDGIIAALEHLDALGRTYGDWFQSVDVNPLVCGPDGVFAVDALFTIAPDPNATPSTA